VLAGQLDVFLGRGIHLFAHSVFGTGFDGQAGTGGAGAVEVFAAQDAAGQGRPGQQADAFGMGDFGQIRLEVTAQQGVFVLDRLHAGQVVVFGQLQPFHDAPGGFVGEAHVADLAGLDQALQGVQHFQEVLFFRLGIELGREVPGPAEVVGAPVGPVQLVQVNVVGLQPAQAAFDGLQQRGLGDGAAVTDPGLAGAGHLGGEDDLVAGAAGLEPVTDDGLGGAVGLGAGWNGVHFRGVEEVDAALQRVIHLFESFFLGVLVTPGHGAQPDQADLQVGGA